MKEYNEILKKKLVEQFKISESSAEAKLRGTGAQMVLEVLLGEDGELGPEIVKFIKSEANARKEELEEAKKAIETEKAALEKEKERVETEKQELAAMRATLSELDTQDMKDRFKLFQIYNQFIAQVNEEIPFSLDFYKTYVKGAIAIISGIPYYEK